MATLPTPPPYPRDLPPYWFCGGLAVMLLLQFCWPVSVWWRAPWTWIGVPVLAAGLGLMLWAAGLFRRLGTGVRPFTAATVVVVTGPYRFTRNPMYLGMVGMTVGAAICLGSATPWLVPPVLVVVLDRRFIRREEEFLSGSLGDAFESFCSRVRRWL